MVNRWRAYLRSEPGAGTPLDEVTAGQMLREFGIAMATGTAFAGPLVPQQLLRELHYPVVLKTAQAGIAHKSDVGGVVLNLQDARSLGDACRDMTARLGPALMVAPMVAGEGIEMILGVARDQPVRPDGIARLWRRARGTAARHDRTAAAVWSCHSIAGAAPPEDAQAAGCGARSRGPGRGEILRDGRAPLGACSGAGGLRAARLISTRCG